MLIVGAILAPGKRTVASALRAITLDNERRFCRYHRVLSRAKWSTQEASRILLGLLVEAFVPEGPLVLGIDETLERRRGKKIAAKGSELAIRRTAPTLLGLFSLVALIAHRQREQTTNAVRRAAWYDKRYPTFSDALALVRKELWAQEEMSFCGSAQELDPVKVPREFIERLTDAVC